MIILLEECRSRAVVDVTVFPSDVRAVGAFLWIIHDTYRNDIAAWAFSARALMGVIFSIMIVKSGCLLMCLLTCTLGPSIPIPVQHARRPEPSISINGSLLPRSRRSCCAAASHLPALDSLWFNCAVHLGGARPLDQQSTSRVVCRSCFSCLALCCGPHCVWSLRIWLWPVLIAFSAALSGLPSVNGLCFLRLWDVSGIPFVGSPYIAFRFRLRL